MKATLLDDGGPAIKLRVDTARRLITTLGAASSIRNLRDQTYLSPAGAVHEPFSLEPLVAAADTTLLTFTFPREIDLDAGTPLSLNMPNANFTGEFVWPSTVEKVVVPPARPTAHSPLVSTIKGPKLALAGYVIAALGLGALLFYVYQQHATLHEERDRLSTSKLELEKDQAHVAETKGLLEAANTKLQADFQRLADLQRYITAQQQKLASEKTQLDEDRKRVEVTPAQTSSTVDSSSPFPPVAQLLPQQTPSTDAVRECDRLASNPADRMKPGDVSGVPYRKIDIAAAVTACQSAIASAPHLPRMRYQLGRALQQRSLGEALFHHRAAADMGYAAAYDNLGRAEVDVRRNILKGAEYFRTGAKLGDVDAMVSLAGLLIDTNGGEEYENERFYWLITARNLGSSAADEILKKHPPPQPQQGIGWSPAVEIMKGFLRTYRP